MLQAVREIDSVGRYGGEEFLIVLGAVDGPEQTAAIAERIRLRLSESPITTSAGPVPLTASLGVATASRGGTIDALVDAADRAMYRAKRAGRNRAELVECVQSVWQAA